jgi:lipopolysaccharide/colanic/teichoic acid biosynthesis glycosyltransferase
MITRSRPDRTMLTNIKAANLKPDRSRNARLPKNFQPGDKYLNRAFNKSLSDRWFSQIYATTEAIFDLSFSYLRYRQLGKRVFDFLFAFSVLTLFSPLYLFLSLLISLSSPGPVLYVQRRIGRHGEAFSCMKFRTMVVDADLALEQLLDQCPASKAEFEDCFKLKDDPRITPIGKWLRMTSLDEFPQFWNVLIGDMSIVGPRPLVLEELPKYGEVIEEVLTIRPGITGLWQVSGRNDIPYDRRIQIDSKYVRRHCLWLDLEIIVRTIGVVIFPKGNGAY